MPLGRRLLFQDLVVEHRPAVIQGDDGVVGQLLLPQAAGLQKSDFDFELGGALREGPGCRLVSERSQPARFAQTDELVRGFCGATIVEMAHESAGVDRLDPPTRKLWKGVADISDFREVLRQVIARCREIASRPDVEMRRPVSLGYVRGLVPEVLGPVENESRTVARLEVNEAIRYVGQRRPYLERGVGLERIGPIVLEYGQEGA